MPYIPTDLTWILISLLLQELDSLLRCPICFDYYSTAMMMPNCSHNCKFQGVVTYVSPVEPFRTRAIIIADQGINLSNEDQRINQLSQMLASEVLGVATVLSFN